MNIDKDTHYAFTRAIADHMLRNCNGVLKVDGDLGNKKKYDPRVYLGMAEAAMTERVKEAVKALRGVGTTLCATK
jgi:fructose-bisphosphate aldolase class II